MVMMLMMTMNLWVNFCIAVGLTLGYAITELYAEATKTKVPQ
jgi:hypothetical protein